MRSVSMVAAALALTCLTFSGCVSSGSSHTAMGGADALDGDATSWASDATLLGLFGVEANGMNASSGFAGKDPVAAALMQDADNGPIDGKLAGWAAGYYSSSKGSIAVFAETKDGIKKVLEELVPTSEFADMPENWQSHAVDARGAWSVDSPAALTALRHANATIDSALATNQSLVLYGISFIESGSWRIQGHAVGVSFSADVDVQTGAVTDIRVSTEEIPCANVMFDGSCGDNLGPLPLPIHQTGTTDSSFDPLNFAQMPTCSSPTAKCIEIPFNTTRDATMDATLTWANMQDDYDFYVLDASGAVVLRGASGPGASVGPPEHVTGDLPAGSYTVQIVPWSALQDTWTFDATFT